MLGGKFLPDVVARETALEHAMSMSFFTPEEVVRAAEVFYRFLIGESTELPEDRPGT